MRESPLVTGKLDEISEKIGAQGAQLVGLNKSFDRHCDDDDRRHEENIAQLRSIAKELATIAEAVKPVIATVAAMKPIVDGYQVSRWKLAGAISLAGFILAGIGWVLSLAIARGIDWLFSAFK